MSALPRHVVLTGLRRRSTIKAFGTAALAGFGAVSALVGLGSGLFPGLTARLGMPGLVAAFCLALGYASWSVWPQERYVRTFRMPATRVSILVGDLFTQPGHLVIGMTDTFDTEPPLIISPASVQGQFLERVYGGDVDKLDSGLKTALADRSVVATELRGDKRAGKLDRYAVGTVAVLGSAQRRYYCLAYSRMSNDCTAESNVTQIWNSLAALWPVVRSTADLGVISIAVLGMGLARLSGQITQDDMIRLIIISYLTASRETVVASHLQIIVPPGSAENSDLRRLHDYLAAQ